jgi:hypothetical protein
MINVKNMMPNLVTSIRHYPVADESHCMCKTAAGTYKKLTVLDSTHHKHGALYDLES